MKKKLEEKKKYRLFKLIKTNSFNLLKTILLLIVTLAVFQHIILRINISYTTFEKDEISWFFHTKFFEQLVINRDFNKNFWSSFESFDHPPLSKYIYGAYLWFHYPNVFKDREILEQQWGRWEFYTNPALQNINDTAFAPYIYTMREVNAVVIILMLILIAVLFFILKKQWLLSLLLPLAIVHHPVFFIHNSLFIHTMMRTTADSHVMLLSIISILVFIYYLYSKQILAFFIFSLFVAMAITAKLTGISLIITYLCFEALQYYLRNNPLIFILKRVSYFMASVLIFWIVINPTLYTNPLINSLKYIQARNSQFPEFQTKYPDLALTTLPLKTRAVICTLFIPTCGDKFGKEYLTHNSLVNISLFILGFIYAVNKAFGKEKRKDYQFLVIYFSCILLIVGLSVPVNYDRYFTPIQIPLFMIQFLGIGIIYEWIIHKIYSSFHKIINWEKISAFLFTVFRDIRKRIIFSDKTSNYALLLFPLIVMLFLLANIHFYHIPNSDFFQCLDEGRQLISAPFINIPCPPIYSILLYFFENVLPIQHPGITGGITFNIVCFGITLYLLWKMIRPVLGWITILPLLVLVFHPLTFSTNIQPFSNPFALLLTCVALYLHNKRPTLSYIVTVIAFFVRYETIVLFIIFILWDILRTKKIDRLRTVLLSLLPVLIWILKSVSKENMYVSEIAARRGEIPNIIYIVNTFVNVPFVLDYGSISYALIIIGWIMIGIYYCYRKKIYLPLLIGAFTGFYSIIHIFFPDATDRYSYQVLPFVYILLCWPAMKITSKNNILQFCIYLFILVGGSYVIRNTLTNRGYLETARWLKAEKRVGAEWLSNTINNPTTIYALERHEFSYYTSNPNILYAEKLEQKLFDNDICNSPRDVIVVIDNQIEGEGDFFSYQSGRGFFEKLIALEKWNNFQLIKILAIENRWAKIYKLDRTSNNVCQN